MHDRLSRALNDDVTRRLDTPLYRLDGEAYVAMHSFLWRRISSQSQRWLPEKDAEKIVKSYLVAAKMTVDPPTVLSLDDLAAVL